MRNAEEIRKSMTSPDTMEVVKLLEALDEKKIVLAKTYMGALADMQQLEKAKKAAAAV